MDEKSHIIINTSIHVPTALWQAFMEQCQREMRDPIAVFNEQVGPTVHRMLETYGVYDVER